MSKDHIIIVNNNDEVIGHKERGTLSMEDIYRVTGLWVTNAQGDILLAQRALTKTHDPGKWGPAVAGTVDEGETYDSNMVKEIWEEIGLKNTSPIRGPKRRIHGQHNYFVQWYTLILDTPAENLVIQKSEVEQVKWYGHDALERELQENPEAYLAGLAWSLRNL